MFHSITLLYLIKRTYSVKILGVPTLQILVPPVFPTKTGKVGRRAEKVKGGSKITLTSSWSKQDCKSHLKQQK